MMDSLLSPITDIELNNCDAGGDFASGNNTYATTPMPVVVQPIMRMRSRDEEEEEVYSSFEQAISGRLEVVQQKLRSLSHSPRYAARNTVMRRTMFVQSMMLPAINRQQLLFLSIFAFVFTLLGFDLMGLLTLLMR